METTRSSVLGGMATGGVVRVEEEVGGAGAGVGMAKEAEVKPGGAMAGRGLGGGQGGAQYGRLYIKTGHDFYCVLTSGEILNF